MLDRAAIGKIDFGKSNLYTLSIRLCADGFSFFIYDPFSAQGLHYFPCPVDVSLPFLVNVKRLLAEEVFQYAYKRVNVVCADARFAFFPEGFLPDDEAHYPLFFYSNCRQGEDERVLCNEWERGNVKILFAIGRPVWELLSHACPEVHVYSSATLLLEYFGSKSSWGNTRKMYACIEDGFLYVFCFDRGHFLFGNSFSVHGAADVLYYLLYVWKQQGYAQERDELHVAGSLASFSGDMLDELRVFVRHVFVMNPDSEFCRMFDGDAETVPFDLQSALLFDFK